MNLYEQLLVVRERLEGIGAHDDSMDLVEKLLKKSEAAKQDRKLQFNNLLHHVSLRRSSATIDLLEQSYFSLKKKAAPGRNRHRALR